jgi:hypothetical protein
MATMFPHLTITVEFPTGADRVRVGPALGQPVSGWLAAELDPEKIFH